jgi:hypothetical protein
MRIGVPFIAPRQLGVVGTPFGRQFLPSAGWRTGQSGAPPDMNSVTPQVLPWPWHIFALMTDHMWKKLEE